MLRKIPLLFVVLILISSFALADTNEIGRDGHYIAYTSGVVYDIKTGLEWYVGPDNATSWYAGKFWVTNLSVAGGGWRMPTVEELKTLYDPRAGKHNMTPLLKTTGWWLWSEPLDSSYSEAWLINFYSSCSETRVPTGQAYGPARIFAVRSRKQEPIDETSQYASISPEVSNPKIIERDGNFVKYDSGIVFDQNTGLEWYIGPDERTTWEDAKKWVKNLSVAGGGWRIPTREELKTLCKKFDTPGWYVWSGETKDSSSAWDFDFVFRFDFGVCNKYRTYRRSVGHPSRRPTQAFAVRSRK